MPADPAAPVTEPRADCVFCGRIKRGEYDGSGFGAVSFEPLNPVVPGHRLFVPGWHCADAREIEGVAAAAKLAAWHASKTDEDFNLITSAGGAATQTVFHLHVHYVPRRPDDGLLLPWSDLPAALLDGHEQQIRAKVCAQLRPLLRAWEIEGDHAGADALRFILARIVARGTEGGTR